MSAYPWQTAQQRRLVAQREQGKLPHALLLAGPRHVGKRDFAFAAAGYLLCQSSRAGEPCGQCDNCHLVNAGTHPDFRLIHPEESKLIRIEQIRDLIEWAGQTAQRGGFKVVVIEPAEQMNVNSANALLKCLEEPADNTVMMLVSDLPGRLLPTIRSRCQHLRFGIPAAQDALGWLHGELPDGEELELKLRIAGGAPLAVTERFDEAWLARRREVVAAIEQLVNAGSPLDVARTFARSDAIADLGIVYSIFADSLRLKLVDDEGGEKVLKNNDIKDILDKVSNAMTTPRLLAVLDAVGHAREIVAGPSNPNPQLLFESLMVEISASCKA